MNNLLKTLPAMSDVMDTLDMLESFDMVPIKKALGDTAFFELILMIQDLVDVDDKILLLGSMDKLINTNKESLVEYQQDRPYLRVDSPVEELRNLSDNVTHVLMNANLGLINLELPELADKPIVYSTLNRLNTMMMLRESNRTGLVDVSEDLGTDLNKLTQLIADKGIDIEKCYDSLYKLNDRYSEFEDRLVQYDNNNIKFEDTLDFIQLLLDIK